jgi:hypothetical protein
MEISRASMAALSSHSYRLRYSNPPKNELQRPLKIHTPLIRSHALRSSQFYSTYTPISKPIAYHGFPKIKKTPLMAESGAYLAGPLDNGEEDEGNLLDKARELQSTLRLVECAMFSAIAGLAYFLSNLLRIENYFGCFFPLPLVISSMRWGISAGRKTMVSTAILLLILSGPLKAASYLLMHGFVGVAMGTLWRLEMNWFLSIIICTLARSIGLLGVVVLSSWLLRENIFALIMINTHASLSYMLAAVGINVVPSMELIYAIFGILLLLNCGSFVFLLHVLYAIFLKRLGIKTSMSLPGWLERAI